MARVSFAGLVLDGFQPIETLDSLEDGADILVPFDLLATEFETLAKTAGRIAVSIPGDSHFKDLERYKDRLALIEINFPVFSDGRGFSLAVRLRKDLGFTGALVATGHVLPDQAQFLLRSGFDGGDVADERQEAMEKAINRFTVFYQHTYNGDEAAAALRHAPTSQGAAA